MQPDEWAGDWERDLYQPISSQTGLTMATATAAAVAAAAAAESTCSLKALQE